MKILETSQKFRQEMEKVLKKNRFDHTLGVAYTAANMAFVFDEDPERALIAGMLHDCAKCMPSDEQIEICRKYGVELTEIELKNPKLIHAKAGMCLAEHKYDIDDKGILDAIRYHTTGRPGMTVLEKIIFTADYIEPNRKMLTDMAIIRKEALSDLDKAVYHILYNTLSYLDSQEDETDPMTLETFEYYKNKLYGKG
ncbi:bis(5'-nucleosyl)-tetraphosphatase (symmetrical) YqeK [Butyrivibrio sp. MC2013]|uniref:bis(5'-nucleosyl)-tetraphosphatase (symmetrical) YqeK n=1 Tax=Butyrivibrio sp. MC2013 TaxID=1280686 RepID=UPI0003FC8096|nr:bis(5'-nucleosyl)-tetraphosphatase (symmetrical) YqeK [Butyrivibrio sp. MC2013]